MCAKVSPSPFPVFFFSSRFTSFFVVVVFVVVLFCFFVFCLFSLSFGDLPPAGKLHRSGEEMHVLHAGRTCNFLFYHYFFSFFYTLWICNSPSLLAAAPLPSVSYKFTMWTFTFLVAHPPSLPTSLLRPSPERFFPLLPQSTLSFPKKRLYLKYSIVSHSECRKFSTGKVNSAKKNQNKN